MDLDLIERLMRLLEASKLDELEVTEDGTRIRLAKSAVVRGGGGAASGGRVAEGHGVSGDSEDGDLWGDDDEDRRVIFAGLAGTFYRRPLPDAEPFINIGDRVEDGSKLALIEAMKMMNPVEADCSGRIVEIHLEDGAAVTAGVPLFTIEKTA